MRNFFFPILWLVVAGACNNSIDNPKLEPAALYSDRPVDFAKDLQIIAFGSCNKEYLPQTMWQDILAQEPDLWLWLGDIIYADTEDMKLMKSKYVKQKSNSEYQKVVKTLPVIGIWDDHDYGINDGGKNYPKKQESKGLLLDFLDVPPAAPVREREGAYQAYVFGKGDRRVKFILLDTRYFRDELKATPSGQPRYFPNKEGDVLGEAQWDWLEEELTKKEAQVHLICSGIQFIPEEQIFEKWGNFPKARKRFFDLIAKTNPLRPILLSGDRHIAEISVMEIPAMDSTITEITSSGLTHSYKQAEEINRYRIGNLVPLLNYGLLKIDWESRPLKFEIQIKGPANITYLSHIF